MLLLYMLRINATYISIMKYNKKLVLPIALALSAYSLSYSIPKVVVDINKVHYLKFAIDELIPLYSPSVVIYVMAFGQWILAILTLLKYETNQGYRVASAFIIGSLIGLATFLIYPTAIIRNPIEVHNVFDWLLSFVCSVDSVVNACPSFHCFCSTIVIHVIWNYKPTNKKKLIINILFSIMVFASTLLTKQHYFIDVPCGILLADISILISKKINFNRLFENINKKLLG